ncbi:hypothetical protein CsSME_00048521 [Camellia sinensis var. sinensis]
MNTKATACFCIFIFDSSTWRIFTYKELQAATNGFSEDNKLGEGAFGSVYWGRTSDGLQKSKSMNSQEPVGAEGLLCRWC